MAELGILQVLGYVFPAFIVIVVGVVTAAAAYVHHLHRMYAHIPGPPLDSFWLGHFPTLTKAQKEGKAFVQLFQEFSKTYGKTMRFFFLNHVLVITLDLESVKDILVTGGHSKASKVYKMMVSIFGARWLGTGLVSECNHERWERKRAMFNPAFHRQFLLTLMPQFDTTGDQLMERLSEFADGKTMVPMLHEFNRAAMDVIGKVAFNMDIGSIKNEKDPLLTAITTTFEGLEKSHNPFNKIDPRLSSYRKEVRDACNFLRKTGRDCIEERKRALADGEYCPQDILTHMISILEENADIDMEELVDEFVTFFIAGQETTSTALAFVLTEVGRHPEIYRRLQQEVDDVMGERSEVTYADLGKLSYTGSVIKETLRLHPVVDMTSRRLAQEQLVGGYRVPANTTVTVSTYIASRCEENNVNALEFNPDRFSGDPSTRPNIYTYFPFSLGPRSCIGQNFAMVKTDMEAKVMMSKFMQRFDFKLDPDQSFETEQKFTFQPKGKAMCTLSLRGDK